MSSNTQKRIPVNIIGGTLGVGKTTTINHLMKQKPSQERWAILVNEYGLIGLDRSLLQTTTEKESSSTFQIKEVAGGCICCSAGFMFEISLIQLLQRRPDRLLIEPTGLASLSGILDTLNKKGIQESVDIRSVICLIDPKSINESINRKEVQDQIDSSDILLASRVDRSSPSQLKEFTDWANNLYPRKFMVGTVRYGQIDLDVLDLVSKRKSIPPKHVHEHGTDHNHKRHHHTEPTTPPVLLNENTPIHASVHQSDQISTIGWMCWKEIVFDSRLVSEWLSKLSKKPRTLRTKAVLRTNEGWWSFNFFDGVEELRPNGYRRDSRIETIISGPIDENVDSLKQQLMKCISPSSPFPFTLPECSQ